MPRLRRPSRRSILAASVLLLAGAVVNVAVAWVLVGAPDSWTPGIGGVVITDAETDKRERLSARLWNRPHPPAAGEGAIVRGLGWTALAGDWSDGPSRRWRASRLDGGWPFRSMTCAARRTPADESLQHTASLEPPRRLLPGPEWFRASYRDRIPLVPIPAGFAINTLFYTVILALPLSFFPVRRGLRVRRGRCPTCGYDLAGLRGACPECGAERGLR